MLQKFNQEIKNLRKMYEYELTFLTDKNSRFLNCIDIGGDVSVES